MLYTGSTLDSFIEGCQDAAAQNDKISTGVVGGDVLELLPREKYADLKLHSQTFMHVEDPPALLHSKAVEEDKSPEKKDVDSNTYTSPEEKSTTNASDSAKESKEESFLDPSILEHNFSLDISPDLLYASGDAVQGLVKSGVADYLEFKSLNGLYLLMNKDDSRKQRTNRGNRRSTQNDSNGGASASEDALISYRVPCSKGDVFRSQLLSPVDKRRLMKFLQLISDYGLAQEDSSTEAAPTDEEGVVADTETKQSTLPNETATSEPTSEDAMYSINERHLNKGRSLSRPQNKAKPSSTELDSLIRCIRDNVNFAEYLTDVAKLPPRLCSVVTHALALAPFGQSQFEYKYSTKNGVDDLLRHVSALGRFGDTAFLIPMYGSGELSQAFCRSGAVYGSTYMLRRSPVSISVNGGNETNKLEVSAVTLSGEEHIAGFSDVDTDDTSSKEVPCSHVIVPSTMMPKKLLTNKSKRIRMYRRISIVKGALVNQQDNQDSDEDQEQRYAVVIPPGTRGLNNASAVHGVVVDDSAFVAPARQGYTVLHLTTSVLESEADTESRCLDILAKSVQLLIESQSSESSDKDRANECHHISFSYSIDIAIPSEESQDDPVASGLHICYRDTQSITCDYAFCEAKRIFDMICPDADFLALAQKVEDSIVYKNNDDDDDERVVLSNALDMIKETQGATEPLDAIQNELADTTLDESMEADVANNVERVVNSKPEPNKTVE